MKTMNTNNRITLKNVWKKPLAAFLSLSILASTSNTCFANEKHEQFAEKMLKQKTEISSADVNADEPALYLAKGAEEAIELAEASEKTEEISPEFKRKLKQYYSLDQYTRAILTIVNSWNGNFDLTPEEEKVINEADVFFSNEENQKLISSSLKSSAKLSKEEEEASKESAEHMLALSKIKDKSNQKTTDKKQETNHDLN